MKTITEDMLPDWEDCVRKDADSMTPLEWFIYNNETDTRPLRWRTQFADAINSLMESLDD